MMTLRSKILTLCLLLTAGGALAQQPAPAASGQELPANDYSRPDAWLCRPEALGACNADLTTTVVAANGTLTREPWTADAAAPVDCFYVYPTVSMDPGPNSDMMPGPEERMVVAQQFARFGAACRLYAPVYRQVTLTALLAGLSGKMMPINRVLAYQDVAAAWRHYLDHDNKGRGVVLIGHSQGSQILTQLLRDEIDGKAVQDRLVSAMLIGTNVGVPKGKDAGGTFQHVPVCRSASQTGCLVTYASFRADAPPASNSFFARVAAADRVAACTNPASPAGGSGELHAYFPARARSFGSTEPPRPWVNPPQPIGTPFVSVPGLLTAECVANEHGSYLAVTVHGDPKDARVDDIPGDVMSGGKVQPTWGLHMIDVNLAIGNLVDLVREQGKAYTAKHGR